MMRAPRERPLRPRHAVEAPPHVLSAL